MSEDDAFEIDTARKGRPKMSDLDLPGCQLTRQVVQAGLSASSVSGAYCGAARSGATDWPEDGLDYDDDFKIVVIG